jgi:hypothetical protein
MIDIVKERERVAEMCSWCDIEPYYDQKTKITTWVALRWCNAIGEKVVGYGDTAWAAVQAAYALHAMHNRDE